MGSNPVRVARQFNISRLTKIAEVGNLPRVRKVAISCWALVHRLVRSSDTRDREVRLLHAQFKNHLIFIKIYVIIFI